MEAVQLHKLARCHLKSIFFGIIAIDMDKMAIKLDKTTSILVFGPCNFFLEQAHCGPYFIKREGPCNFNFAITMHFVVSKAPSIWLLIFCFLFCGPWQPHHQPTTQVHFYSCKTRLQAETSGEIWKERRRRAKSNSCAAVAVCGCARAAQGERPRRRVLFSARPTSDGLTSHGKGILGTF